MWDLTVPGNGDHDFYVVAGSTPVLVHNTNGKCTIPSAAQNPDQVTYGSTDLSLEVLKARVLDNNKGNLYAAARYTDANGDVQTLVTHSDKAGHADEHMISELQNLGVSAADVTDLYVEYFPCSGSVNCLGNIIPQFTNPSFKLSCTFDWNSDPDVQAAARAGLKAAIKDLWPPRRR
jgi:hypothetical protein